LLEGKTQTEVIKLKEYEILYDTGEARRLVAQINRMAKNHRWQGFKSRALIEDCMDICTVTVEFYWNWFLHLPSHSYLSQTALRRFPTIMSFQFSYECSAKPKGRLCRSEHSLDGNIAH
jgi:hypothetical protein